MNNLETNKTETVLRNAASKVEEIREGVKSGRITDVRKASEDTAMELFVGIEAMFKEDPVRAASSLAKTFKDSFRDGLYVGFIIGAVLAFATSYFIS